ncbi:hypothetical protein CEXT_648081 [Caerostris extrusa]|uniref:Uncharacterized protein n=1 Tax=Caerostris extrusa TaxID=172846 RepID=A0AAV4XZI9_CAEEX|nr:hypothetical protein CEXT_648081 [Caerostris extrusa]
MICIPHYSQHHLTPWPLIVPIPAELFKRNGISNSALRPNAPALSVLSSQDIRSRVSNKLRGMGVPSMPLLILLRTFIKDFLRTFHHTALSQESSSLLRGGKILLGEMAP